MSDNQETEKSTPESLATESAAPAAELTVQDLQALKAIIDVASQRGSFKPNEMVTVGQVYNKLEVFLDSIAQQQATTSKGE